MRLYETSNIALQREGIAVQKFIIYFYFLLGAIALLMVGPVLDALLVNQGWEFAKKFGASMLCAALIVVLVMWRLSRVKRDAIPPQ